MANIYDYVESLELLLGLPSEEVAYRLLLVARANVQNGIFHPNSVTEPRNLMDQRGLPPADRDQAKQEQLALKEAWHWIEQQGLVVPAEGINGNNGSRQFSRRGLSLLTRANFGEFVRASAFPKTLLHPSIADRVWLALARGELDTAVFHAFKAVEEAVRTAGGYAATDIGVALMRKAFDASNGPLRKHDDPESERQALGNLFAGAIGSYKNPHSHRTVAITEAAEAQEQVMLATHLLRIVDARVAQRQNT